MPKKIVHIGFPKTGSTFLQKSVFPLLLGLEYVDFRTCVKLFEDLIYLDDLDYEDQKSIKNFSNYPSEKILFSQEALTGPPFTFKGLNRSQIPIRLKGLGFSKVIITIRNQVDIIDSLYRQYVYQGGVMRFKGFLNLDGNWNHYLRAFNLDYLKYDRLIIKYIEMFGDGNVLILPQEILKNDPDNYISILGEFLGERIELISHKGTNESLTNASTNLLRFINHFTFNSQRPNQLVTNKISTKTIKKIFQVIIDPYFMKLIAGKKSYLKPEQKEQIEQYYSQSNFELKKLVDYNLSGLGYISK